MPIILCIPDRTLAFIIMKNCCIFAEMKNKKTDQETMEDIAASNSSNFFMIDYPKIWSIFVLRDSGLKKTSIIFGERIGKKFSWGGGIMIWKNSRAFTRLINLLNFKTYVLIRNCIQFQCLKHIHTSRKITVAERYVYIKISERKMCFEICCKLQNIKTD